MEKRRYDMFERVNRADGKSLTRRDDLGRRRALRYRRHADGVAAISEAKPGDQGFNGGRWHVNLLNEDVDPEKYADATSVEDLDLDDFHSTDMYFECPCCRGGGTETTEDEAFITNPAPAVTIAGAGLPTHSHDGTQAGWMFWFVLKRFVGSYFVLSSRNRS